MTRRFYTFAPLAALSLAGALCCSLEADAQSESVLAEVYGRGVHAYYAGQYSDSVNYLTQAIDGGTRDPRAYFFRGIVSYNQGQTAEAEADWEKGAQMEARSGGGGSVGQSLSRFQGAGRLKLEQIRQEARLDAAITAAARSNSRLDELGVQPSANPGAPAVSAPPVAVRQPPAAPAAPAADDPFADDGPAMAGGEPTVGKTNALEGATGNPFADDPAIGAEAGAAASAPAAGSSNPFDAPAAPAAGGADPFGGGADPFGGGASDAGADPFGGSDPFGN